MRSKLLRRLGAPRAWLICGLLALVHCSAERPPAKAPGTSRQERLARYHESAKKISKELGELGFPVKISEVTLALGEREQDVTTFVEAAFAYSSNSYEGLATLLRALGLSKGATASALRWRSVISELLSVEAYYDPVGQAMVLRSSSFDEFSDFELVIAHELAHAYQDQALGGLEAFLNVNASNLDRSRSARSIVEGQAMLIAHAVLLKRRGRTLADLDLSLNEESTEQLLTGEGAGITYAAGQRFLLAQYKSGGWPAVHAAYRSPPVSTEQLLHPEKYRADTPRIVTLPGWPNAADEVHLLSTEVIGELLIKSTLAAALTSEDDTNLEGRNLAETVSMGWDGDRFESYELESGQRAALWRSVWETEPAAREFAGALRRFISKQKLEPKHYDVRQRDIVVDFAFSEDEALVPALARALEQHPRHFRPQPEDEASTAAAKAAAAARHARQPRVEGKYWVHPRSAARLPIPEGWQVRLRSGLPQLRGEEEEGFAPSINAFRVQDVWDGDVRGFMRKLEEAYFANPSRFGQVESEIRRIAGTDVGVITLRVGGRAFGVMVRLWLIPRSGHYLLLSAGFAEDTWKESAPLLASFERGLVLEPAEP